MNKPRLDRVAVLMGGPSAEREISLRSGRAVWLGLRQAGYDAVAVDVRRRTLELPPDIDAVFIALHGEFGEDGQVQSLLEARGLPYTGAGPEASRLAFDKVRAKQVLADRDIPTPPCNVLQRGGRRTLPLPVFVKPVQQGSSLGCHKVCEESDWPAAIEDALRYTEQALVERFIEGRELTVGIVDCAALPILEIYAPDTIYDYRAKYTPGLTRYEVPARVDEPIARRCQEISLAAFRALGARGMGRVDLRLAPDGTPFVLELNTIPGFTETSLLPKAAAAAGYSFPALCDRIMQTARLDAT